MLKLQETYVKFWHDTTQFVNKRAAIGISVNKCIAPVHIPHTIPARCQITLENFSLSWTKPLARGLHMYMRLLLEGIPRCHVLYSAVSSTRIFLPRPVIILQHFHLAN